MRMDTTLHLPKPTALPPIDPRNEPNRYYYWPVVGWFYRKRLRMVLECLPGSCCARLLEVAYGSGIFLPDLARRSRCIYGIDLHPRAATVRERLSSLGVRAHLLPADVLALPFGDGTFDAVVSVSMLEHLHDPGSAIASMSRVLKPGGILVLGFPCRNPWMDAFFRILGYNPRAIHPSSHRDILSAIAKLGYETEIRILPRWAPLDHALYCVCVVHP